MASLKIEYRQLSLPKLRILLHQKIFCDKSPFFPLVTLFMMQFAKIVKMVKNNTDVLYLKWSSKK